MKDTAVIFDLDGTLLDTLEDLTDAVNHVLTERGCPERTIEEIRVFVGNGAKKLIDQALPGRADDPDRLETFRAFQAYYNAHCQIKTRPYDGILEALETLAGEGYPLAVVSNKPDTAVKPLAKQYFPGLYARGESPECPRKPAPDMVFRAAEALGVEPKHCIYVGDSEVDIKTSANAGMRCISVLWGFRREAELRAAGGDCFCSNPGDLVETVKKLEREIHGQ